MRRIIVMTSNIRADRALRALGTREPMALAALGALRREPGILLALQRAVKQGGTGGTWSRPGKGSLCYSVAASVGSSAPATGSGAASSSPLSSSESCSSRVRRLSAWYL